MVKKLFIFQFFGGAPWGPMRPTYLRLRTWPYFLLDQPVYQIWFRMKNCDLQSANTHIYTHTHTQTHIYTHTHTQTHIHIHMHIHTYTHTHIHTYTHTHRQSFQPRDRWRNTFRLLRSRSEKQNVEFKKGRAGCRWVVGVC